MARKDKAGGDIAGDNGNGTGEQSKGQEEGAIRRESVSDVSTRKVAKRSDPVAAHKKKQGCRVRSVSCADSGLCFFFFFL